MANLRGGSDMGPLEGVYQRMPAVGQGILQLADCPSLVPFRNAGQLPPDWR